MARRALIVGVNKYPKLGAGATLKGAVPDADDIERLLARHSNGDPNYTCIKLTSDSTAVTRVKLRESLAQLFRKTNDEMLFYFSGHGTVTDNGGYILTQDAVHGDLGIPMDEILQHANNAADRDALIILDCCMSGAMGNPQALQGDGAYQRSMLNQHVSILAASRENESAVEAGGHGLFTALLIDALEGAAADIVGNVTLPAIYAHIEGALGPWDQRPIYKTYTTSVSIIRRADPRIPLPTLRRLTELFPDPSFQYQLTPDHEYDKSPQTDAQRIGQLFKRYRDAGLLCAAEEGSDFYWVAMESGHIVLTPLGRHIWRQIKGGRI